MHKIREIGFWVKRFDDWCECDTFDDTYCWIMNMCKSESSQSHEKLSVTDRFIENSTANWGFNCRIFSWKFVLWWLFFFFRLSELLKPLLGRTRSRDRCWAAIQLSDHLTPSGHAVRGEVDGLDIGGQHGRRFVLLRHTHRPQRRPYLIYTSRSGNVRHRCGGG